MTRILALHGVGSSATILKDQLSVLLEKVAPNCDVHYLDGCVERDRGPGMASYYQGPFYSYTTGYTPREIREVFEDIDDFINDHGPFDGVIGFSQGASMAASYLLDWQHSRPDELLPFHFAIFISSVAAFSGSDSCSHNMIDEMLKNKLDDVKSFPDYGDGSLDEREKTYVDYLALTFLAAKHIGAVSPDDDIEFFSHQDLQMVPRILHPSLHKIRLRIPTVHIFGSGDLISMTEQSKLVYGLCEEPVSRLIKHSGGHSVPSRRAEVIEAAKHIEWAIIEGANRHALEKTLAKVRVREVL
ncbi:hypothetical protein EKO27_g1710 [Xylaria grammica]|uniref:Serine hydrolase domain-containing protein n=1 Tax=Xylaria grammica TaxID=363999 RepID=A0A439DG30_9PEZI|nr:hypothetical protein EKO27_g1710 [Xylaria grammica]